MEDLQHEQRKLGKKMDLVIELLSEHLELDPHLRHLPWEVSLDCNIQIQCAGLSAHSPGQELQKKQDF